MRKGRKHTSASCGERNRQSFPLEEKVDMELNLHGFQVDEALVETERTLDSLSRAGLTRLRVIHGQPRSGTQNIHSELMRRLQGEWREKVRHWYKELHNPGATIIVLHKAAKP